MSNYPYRPARKGKVQASENGGGKRKTWMSDRSKVENGRDTSPRLNAPWWKAPMFKEARTARWDKKDENA